MRKIGIVLLVLWWGCLQAQQVKRLSIQEAMDLAVQNSHQVQIDELKKEALEIKKQQIKSSMLPNAGVNATYSRVSKIASPVIPGIPAELIDILNPNILNQSNNQFFVQQQVFSGLKNWNMLKAMEQQKLAAGFNSEKDRDDVKLNTIQAYYNLYKLQQSKILLDSNIVQAQIRVDNISRYKEAGIVLNNDVMRAQLQQTNLLTNKADVESAIRINNYMLCVMLGLDTKTIIEVYTPSVVNDAKYAISSLVSSAYSERPELKAQAYRSKAAEFNVKASRSAYMPTVNLLGESFISRPNMRIFPQEAKFKTTWDVGVSLNWNIMQLYKGRSEVKEAANEKAQLEKSTEAMRDAIQLEVNAGYELLKVALLKIDLAQAAITQATENKRILDNRFEAQVALFTDVLEADQLLLQSQVQLLNAKADAAIAYYKLQRSLGNIK
jgi:outer membrane protein TolC